MSANRRGQRELRRERTGDSETPMAAAVAATDDGGGSVGPLVALPNLHAMFPASGAGELRTDTNHHATAPTIHLLFWNPTNPTNPTHPTTLHHNPGYLAKALRENSYDADTVVMRMVGAPTARAVVALAKDEPDACSHHLHQLPRFHQRNGRPSTMTSYLRCSPHPRLPPRPIQRPANPPPTPAAIQRPQPLAR